MGAVESWSGCVCRVLSLCSVLLGSAEGEQCWPLLALPVRVSVPAPAVALSALGWQKGKPGVQLESCSSRAPGSVPLRVPSAAPVLPLC